ncbi:MAG: 3-hydroxyacyl-ACP dehydratase FabZ family protein [Bradymonadaceae bacterium]
MNPEEIDRLLRKYRKRPLIAAGDLPNNFVERSAELPIRLLPHRGPMLLVDELVGVNPEEGIAYGRRHIHSDHLGLDGHFPNYPVLPGTIQIEILGQLALCMYRFLDQDTVDIDEDLGELNLRATKILGAHFLSEIRPGDDVHLLAKKLHVDEFMGVCIAQALVGPTVCCVMAGEVVFL